MLSKGSFDLRVFTRSNLFCIRLTLKAFYHVCLSLHDSLKEIIYVMKTINLLELIIPVLYAPRRKNPSIETFLKPLYNSHLFTRATFFCTQGGCCRDVRLVLWKKSCFYDFKHKMLVQHVLLRATKFSFQKKKINDAKIEYIFFNFVGRDFPWIIYLPRISYIMRFDVVFSNSSIVNCIKRF